MTNRDNALWQQYWRDRRTDFHQKTVNPLLIRFWPGLGLAPGSRVLVPLCGKSLDMLWLVEQGYRVLGIELSALAVRAFFREHQMQPTRRNEGLLTRWGYGNLGILCGDFFAMTEADLGPVDAIYDHTAFTALPEDIRRPYVAHLNAITPAARKLLLLTAEDADEGQSPAQASAAAPEIAALYGERFEIELSHVEPVIGDAAQASDAPPECVYYKVYRLSQRNEGQKVLT